MGSGARVKGGSVSGGVALAKTGVLTAGTIADGSNCDAPSGDGSGGGAQPAAAGASTGLTVPGAAKRFATSSAASTCRANSISAVSISARRAACTRALSVEITAEAPLSRNLFRSTDPPVDIAARASLAEIGNTWRKSSPARCSTRSSMPVAASVLPRRSILVRNKKPLSLTTSGMLSQTTCSFGRYEVVHQITISARLLAQIAARRCSASIGPAETSSRLITFRAGKSRSTVTSAGLRVRTCPRSLPSIASVRPSARVQSMRSRWPYCTTMVGRRSVSGTTMVPAKRFRIADFPDPGRPSSATRAGRFRRSIRRSAASAGPPAGKTP